MNINSFKNIVSSWDKIDTRLKEFRVCAENYYDFYKKKVDIIYCEAKFNFETDEKFESSSACESLNVMWKYIPYSTVLNIYNKMGWLLPKEIKEKRMSYDMEAETFYYKVEFEEIYKIIVKLTDNFEFIFAILLLIQGISSNLKLYCTYARNIYKSIKEYELNECLDLINDIKKVFVAMSFSENMKKIRRCIEEAIRDNGYEPILIDSKEHNNQIVPEIYAEIDESLFVIADLTGQRGGVYYEAGYAVAKNKPLIICCKKGEITHFDVAQINTIFWEDENDLYERLCNRIKCSIGEIML